MPKELITGDNPFSTPVTSDDRTPHVECGVQVTWGREASYVQVATGQVPSTGFATESAFFTSLNRHGINNLIRVLRKARDQAFGADA